MAALRAIRLGGGDGAKAGSRDRLLTDAGFEPVGHGQRLEPVRRNARRDRSAVGNLTFVPTLDPEGTISVIDNPTWTNVKNIDVGGPGLFIRHHPTAESAEEYPYVWAETAFGDFHDEIYVIDVRSLEIVETLRPVPGESSWHPEFTYDGQSVYVVSQTGQAIVVYDADTFEENARVESKTPSAAFNMGIRTHEAGL